MKFCGKCSTTKSLTEFYRRGLIRQPWCKECCKAAAAQRYLTNRVAHQAKQRAWAQAHRKERAAARHRAYLVDPEKSHAVSRAWRKKNLAYDNFRRAWRRATVKQATPKWADKKIIQEAYQEARYHGLHVDHIVPLTSPLVCGLHVWDNLELITPRENHSKRNRYWPEMPNG